MKWIVCLYSGLLVISLFSFAVDAQEATPTPEPLPTLSRNSPPWDMFPSNLLCYEMPEPSGGPTWGDITIGSSTVEDLKTYVSSIYNYNSITQWADYISFSGTEHFLNGSGIPPLIGACLDVRTQIVTALRISINRAMYIEDLVAIFGIPDTITWGSSNVSRGSIWFDKGIAASVYILEEDDILDYGEIGLIIYFPYQSAEGFETRWPYTYTNAKNPTGGDVVYDPPPSELQNPFDFEAMIATITAEPTRTPTPTFVPRLFTATPTP